MKTTQQTETLIPHKNQHLIQISPAKTTQKERKRNEYEYEYELFFRFMKNFYIQNSKYKRL